MVFWNVVVTLVMIVILIYGTRQVIVSINQYFYREKNISDICVKVLDGESFTPKMYKPILKVTFKYCGVNYSFEYISLSPLRHTMSYLKKNNQLVARVIEVKLGLGNNLSSVSTQIKDEEVKVAFVVAKRVFKKLQKEKTF